MKKQEYRGHQLKNKIPSALLAEVKAEDKARFIQDYNEANFCLEVIKTAIEKKWEVLLDQEEDPRLFQEPGYAAHYAHIMGQRKMAKTILNLFPNKKG